ncbi:uncharacterized protein CELE_C47E8.9 [Caenorhabditis elegans]|uniref:Secreted protein n=1 Tax=Caenorhabditis elegans TaxID=6239 RepID=K8FDY5_CAEEL|nr:Secreted protein [Caenorhabditis elegans]CCO25619.1 Secreted protein [Caenorhabditis elegans]|eukprot:NP_001263888.1 Uncharacterized protein CELE_C47E8.9 [Caenorhabditis elegans]
MISFRATTLHLLTTLYLVDCAPILPNVQTGYVPIFGNRVTLEPITFTFTTPPPKTKSQWKSFPTLRPFPSSAEFLNSLPGPEIQNNVPHSNHIKEWKYEVQMPTHARPFAATTPEYSQALIYKAMQNSLKQDVYSTYRTMWKQMMDTWLRLRSHLLSDGVEQDWHMFWRKFTGTVEPYMTTISTQIGKFLNVFLRHQHEKEVEESTSWGG